MPSQNSQSPRSPLRTGVAWPPWTCPDHRAQLADRGDSLTCPQDHAFPVQDGIPRFVGGPTYADGFGAQWQRFRETQLDSRSGLTLSRDRARRCIGPSAWAALDGAQVLECGAGAGRFTEVLLAQGANVTSIDLSSAVEANSTNFPVGPCHRVAQADILRPPFAPGQFDLVFCLGVVQHTPDPEATMAALDVQVRPGGWLVLDHYAYTLSWFTRTAPLYRWRLRRLPPDEGLAATERLVARWLPRHRRARGSRWANRLLYRLSPIISYYQAYPTLPEDLQREWALLDTHDSLTDWHKHLRTRRAIAATLASLGLTEVACERAGTVIEARGRRPSLEAA